MNTISESYIDQTNQYFKIIKEFGKRRTYLSYMISDTKLRRRQKHSPLYQMIQKEGNLSMKMIT